MSLQNQLGIAEAATGTGSVISSLISGALNSPAQQYKYAKKFAKFQNDLNVQNWMLQNNYNSPVSKMQRLQAAGLNPQAISGVADASGIQSAGSFSPSSSQVADFTGLQNALGQVSQVVAQQDAHDMARAQIQGQQLQNRGVELDNLSKELYGVSTSEATLKGLNLQNSYTQKLTDKVDVDVDKVKSDIQVNQANLKNLGQTFLNLQEELQDKRAQRYLTDAQRQQAYAQTRFISESIAKLAVETAISEVDLKYRSQTLESQMSSSPWSLLGPILTPVTKEISDLVKTTIKYIKDSQDPKIIRKKIISYMSGVTGFDFEKYGTTPYEFGEKVADYVINSLKK